MYILYAYTVQKSIHKKKDPAYSKELLSIQVQKSQTYREELYVKLLHVCSLSHECVLTCTSCTCIPACLGRKASWKKVVFIDLHLLLDPINKLSREHLGDYYL